jgi:hypothetical protein
MTGIAPVSSRTHLAGSTPPHEHGWLVESQHSTTQGLVVYVRCAACRALRVDLQERPDVPPSAVTRVMDA